MDSLYLKNTFQEIYSDFYGRLRAFFNRFDLNLNIRYNVSKFYFRIFRSSHLEVFLGKCVLKIRSKFTGEHPHQSVISKNL